MRIWRDLLDHVHGKQMERTQSLILYFLMSHNTHCLPPSFFSAWCRLMLAVRGFRYSASNSLSHHFNRQPQGLWFKTYLFYCLERMFSKCDYLCKLRKDFNKFQIFCSILQKKTIFFQLFKILTNLLCEKVQRLTGRTSIWAWNPLSTFFFSALTSMFFNDFPLL